jgi:hypothetical protein
MTRRAAIYARQSITRERSASLEVRLNPVQYFEGSAFFVSRWCIAELVELAIDDRKAHPQVAPSGGCRMPSPCAVALDSNLRLTVPRR